MSKKNLKRTPHIVNKHQWWYEENGGISVLSDMRLPNGNHLITTQVFIRWTSLRAALARKDKP